MRIPDGMTPLIGWRAWNVTPQGLLVGQAHAELWPPYQAFRAACYGGATAAHLLKGGQFNPAPVLMCSCGIHCYKGQEGLQNRLDAIKENFWQYEDFRRNIVWGTVKLWGTIIEHDLGYRAEYAYPYELTAHDSKIAKMVSQLYGIECHYEALPEPEPEPAPSDEDILTALLGRSALVHLNPFRGGPIYFVPSQSRHTFWRNIPAPAPPPAQPLITPSWTQVQAYGAMVGASRWQKRTQLYQGGGRGGMKTLRHWQEILKRMVYLDPKKTEEEVDKLTLRQV